jgi:hypothetical protein
LKTHGRVITITVSEISLLILIKNKNSFVFLYTTVVLNGLAAVPLGAHIAPIYEHHVDFTIKL